ncbi:helix-turn-helix domain-containing protein [Streptomyces sp. H27-D2]|uniref:helix-turn-helix domain-containing protein n=1 Tax=Streptomyces sp. H27-D2 TaxID=3046304 RepID=UPI002DC03356|nr:helix-turn-helix transcriptional regulator [Streptomyces sp. H27-D2]MEC4017356.1 helix-turn-helix transcriptional regulator [Streptomyces sp. H27-D2]
MSTVLGRRLGGELLRMREISGLKQPQAAEALTASVAKVAKVERGWVPVRDPDIRALCHLYEVDDVQAIDGLLRLAKLDRERRKAKGWWQQFPEANNIAEYIAMEDVASQIRTWQLSLVPGLFQTAEYARSVSVSSGSWEDPDEIDRLAEIKLNRQARLFGHQPVQFYAVVWEAALRQVVGGSNVMHGQLERILELAQLPNVRLQVLPFRAGAHASMSNMFNIISFAEEAAVDVVYSETVAAAFWLESRAEAALHATYFDYTTRASLSQRDSVALIDSIRKEI